MSGSFIVFEGIDGSGKTTQISLLSKKIKSLKKNVLNVAEPTTSLIGNLLRNAFSKRIEFAEPTIAALMAADRLDHILNKNGLLSNKKAGFNIIADRYYFSSYAYNVTKDSSLDWVISLNSIASKIFKPDAIIYLDIDVETSIFRIEEDRRYFELYENKKRLEEVSKNYKIAFEKLKDEENIIIIDVNNKTEDEIHKEIWLKVEKIFN